MKSVEKVEEYIKRYLSTRFDHYLSFYESEYRDRKEGIYRRKQGHELLNYLNNIVSNIEHRLLSDNLIPEKFATPENLLYFLQGFKNMVEDGQHLLDLNDEGDETSYEVREIRDIRADMLNMLDQAILLFDYEDLKIPYLHLRSALISKDTDTFFKILGSLLASVSYAIAKTSEGFIHSNIYLLLKVLGFDIIPEESTNVGRIDAVLRLAGIVYIMEFKLGTSDEAMEQIHEKKYYEKFIHEGKEIILIGVGFDEETRNINSYKVETLE